MLKKMKNELKIVSLSTNEKTERELLRDYKLCKEQNGVISRAKLKY